MVSVSIAVEGSIKAELESFPWVNWSGVGSEEARKKEIFENFIKGVELSKEEEEFCEKINWDPLDEMELREEFIEKLKKIEKEPLGKPMTVKEFNKWCDSL
ncbi:MAG: hypothetical protein U9Q69_05315 [Nanoarchaeota archaeon]|nr:hypothetical protein [Nanoarchaeota archaeon]